ncbi:MAG: hypothetical protein ACERKD_08610 [Prolixibacteraceae bacterium]
MKRFTILILLIFIFSACAKNWSETRIIIKNETNSELNVKLFPNKKYLNPSGDFYRFSADGSGSGPNEFVLGTDDKSGYPKLEILYYTNDLTISASDLARQIFDSIQVVVNYDQSTILVFTHDSAKGYTQNLFADDSAWAYELNSYDEPIGRSISHIEANEYTFSFVEEKFDQ